MTESCNGMPLLCCQCRTCNLRRVSTTFTQTWGTNTRTDKYELPLCAEWVVDVKARGSIYVLCARMYLPHWYVQKRTLAGELLWETEIVPDLRSSFTGWRVDSDDTTVWVCALVDEFSSQTGFFAFSADDGTLLWTKQYPHYDVCPDGTGGCIVAMWSTPSGCSAVAGTDPDPIEGNVRRYDSSGNVVLAFGVLSIARSVLLDGSKVWVGGNATSFIECFCTEVGQDAPLIGSVVRHDLATGDVELVCAGGEWGVSDGCIVQFPFMGSDAFVNRLVVSGGKLLCGIFGADRYDCLIFALNMTTGAVEESYDLSVFRELPYSYNCVRALVDVGGTFFFIPTTGSVMGGGFVVSSGQVKRHKGYLRDLWPQEEYIQEGAYMALSYTGSDLIAGGQEAGCVLYDDNVSPGGQIAGDCTQGCECGGFNTRGQAVVGCGCEDGVDPTCEAYLNLEFTGCLASLSGVVNLQYNNCRSGSCYNCTAGQHHWTGSTSGSYDPFAVTSINCCEVIDGDETENCSECCASPSMSIDVCYDCVTGWILKFWVTVSSAWYSGTFKFTGVIESENCNPPTFTFTWDGTADSSTGTGGDFLTDCCGGTTGCGGFNTNGCGIMLCCDEPFPTTLTATFSAANCAALHGTSLTLNYVGEISANIHAWEASINIAGCGDCTFRFQINNNVACEWAMGIQQDSSGTDIWGCFDSDCNQGSISCPFVSASYTNSIPTCAFSLMDCFGDLTVVVA